jgi:hypothetical protein
MSLPSFAIRPGATVPDWSVVASPVTKEALLAMLDADHILHRWQGYGPAEDCMRTSLLRLYAEHGHAPTIAGLASHTGLWEFEVREVLLRLRERDLVVLDAQNELVVGAYPFTEQDTGHHVKLNGRAVNAMCAVDALGVGDMYGRDVEIDSRCRVCDAPIKIATCDRGRALEDFQPQTAVVWLGLHYEEGCAARSLCTVTTFFCTDSHLDAWRREQHSDVPGTRLSILEALEAGRAIFRQSLASAESIDGRSAD